MAKTAAKSKSKSSTPAKKAPAKPVAKKAAPAKKAPVKAAPAAKKPVAKSVARKEVAKPATKPVDKKPAKPAAAPVVEAVKAKTKPAAATAAAVRPKSAGVVAQARPRPAGSDEEPVGLKPRKREPVSEVRLPAGYKPTAKEEYMSPKQLEYFRLKLIKWREDLIEESQQTIDNLRDEVRDVGDEAERAQRETENSLELRTRDRYRKLLSQIDKALKRIEEGEYGFCEETGEPIGIERLEVRPIARFSIDAQERWELRQKHMGE